MGVEVTLHFWSLVACADDQTRFATFLSEDETARLNRFVYDPHRDAYLAARGRLRDILGVETGRSPADLQFHYGPQGKPFLPDGPQFNLSHAGDIACLAIHPDIALGVDIEAHRYVEPGLAARFFSPAENLALNALPASQREAAFFRCWTRKEAVIKALGGGLSIPLDAFDVTLDTATPELTHIDAKYGTAAEWRMTHIGLGPRMVGAIAAQTDGAPIRPRIGTCPSDIAVVV